MAKKQNKEPQKYFELIMREAFCKKLSDYLDSLLMNGVVVKTEVKRGFGMDYKTINNVCLRETPISNATLCKMPYILAYSLAEYKKKLNAQEFGHERNKKLEELPSLVEEFKALFGFQATFCLDLIEKGNDLREIVKHP